MKTKHVREITAFAKHLGLKVVTEMTKGTHVRFILESRGGAVMRMVTSLTPSDTRATKNICATIKKFSRGEISDARR